MKSFLYLTITALLTACSQQPTPPEPAVSIADNAAIKTAINDSSAPLLLVHVWATWCDPCIKEFPVLLQTAETYAPKMELLLISADDPNTPEVVRAFLRNQDSPHGSLIAANLNQDFIEALSPKWPGALPASFFYRDGKLLAEHTGPMNRQQYTDMIEPLLK